MIRLLKSLERESKIGVFYEVGPNLIMSDKECIGSFSKLEDGEPCIELTNYTCLSLREAEELVTKLKERYHR